MSIGRCGASWAASTRMRPPTAWTFSASSCTGCTTPVTFDAPDTARRATRPACSARRRSRSSTSSVPSGRTPTCTVRNRPRHGRSFEWCSSIVVSTTESVVGGQRAGEPVDRLGRVLGEHDDVALGVGADELADELPRPFERDRARPATCSRFPDGRPSRTAGTRRWSRPPTGTPACSRRCRGSRTERAGHRAAGPTGRSRPSASRGTGAVTPSAGARMVSIGTLCTTLEPTAGYTGFEGRVWLNFVRFLDNCGCMW